MSMSSSYPFPSQDSSIHTYPCKWQWCRVSFPDNAQLVQHVIHEHVRKAIAIRRKDIPLDRRAEEGSGESLQVPPYMLYNRSLGRVSVSPRKSIGSSVKDVRPRQSVEPSSSLPSPPVSSPMLFSQPQNLPNATQSPRPRSEIPPAIIDPAGDIHDLQTQARASTPAFGSIGSPTGSHASLPIPGSPSYSSLVYRQGKRALTFHTPEHPLPKKPNTAQDHQYSSQSSLNRRLSTGSQAAVEQQLTQLDDESNDSGSSSSSSSSSEEDSEQDAVEDNVSDEDESPEDNDHVMEVDPPVAAYQSLPAAQVQDDVYISELNLALLRPEISQPPSQPSQIQMPHMELLSQPPSQLQHQHSTFPFHIHGPRKSVLGGHSEPDSSLALNSSPAPLSNPAFAVSTPANKQNWYLPPLTRTASGQKVNSPIVAQGRSLTPANSAQPAVKSSAQHSARTSSVKSKKFRSGTLQLRPAAAMQGHVNQEVRPAAPAPTITHAEVSSPESQSQSQSQSQALSYVDSSQSQPYQDSFLLQTQAPYQSQPMSQF